MGTSVITLDGLTIGEKVRLLRIYRKWSQADLAQLSKTTQGVVSRTERNVPSVEREEKAKVLRVLGITTDE